MHSFIATQMWEDDEITGRIAVQLQHLFPEALLADQKDRFFKHAFAAMHKLSATKYHLENYVRIESYQFQSARKQFKKGQTKTREAFELIFELEAFLVQVKSSLDMLVKLIVPAIGDSTVKTRTFSNAGNDVIKGLEQFQKRKDAPASASHIIALIRQHQPIWLRSTIELRDQINHYQGLKDYRFLPLRLSNGEITAQKPQFLKQDTVKLMEVIYSNNLIFHQDFMALTLALRAPSVFTLAPVEEQMAKEWGKYSKFVKYGWQMSLALASEG